jgi:four helix bundle protein
MFIAYEVSRQLIVELRGVVGVIEREDKDLAAQLRRAANSIVLNLAEGQRSLKGNKHKHYAIAHGSANEVKAVLHTAEAWGWALQTEGALAQLDRLLALLWRLIHPQPTTHAR